MTTPDPTQDSRLRLLFQVLREMDAAIVEVYRERGRARCAAGGCCRWSAWTGWAR